MNITVQETPVGLGRAQELITVAGISESPGEHIWTSVSTHNIKTLFQQPHRMEACTRRHIEHGTRSMLFEKSNEKITFGFGSGIPVDQPIPAVCEIFDVLLLVMIRFPNRFRSF